MNEDFWLILAVALVRALPAAIYALAPWGDMLGYARLGLRIGSLHRAGRMSCGVPEQMISRWKSWWRPGQAATRSFLGQPGDSELVPPMHKCGQRSAAQGGAPTML